MPYIKQDARDRLAVAGAIPQDAGELNYAMTTAALRSTQLIELRVELRLIAEQYIKAAPIRYSRINDVLGAFTGAAFEFARRTGNPDASKVLMITAAEFYADIGVPYEQTKIAENGDVYP